MKLSTQMTILPFYVSYTFCSESLIKHSVNVKNASGISSAVLYCRYLKLAPTLGGDD